MSGKENDNPQEQQAGLASVGARLAEVRSQQQRSMESIASELRLPPEIVRAIETGDEAKLPAATFLRGYVKSYARVLGIDDAPLTAQLPSIEGQRPAALKRVGMRRPGVSLPVGKWLVSVSLLAAVALMVIYGVPTVERLWSVRTEEPVSDQLQLPTSPTGEETDMLELPESDAVPAQLPVPATAVEPAAATQESGEADEAPLSERPPVAAEAVEQEVSPAPQDQPAVAGPAVVKMRFIEDSWVEMEAHGRKLVVGTQPAGSERTVRAEPPIQLLLGNAPGVELTYRGERVDMTPHQRGKVARLTLEN